MKGAESVTYSRIDQANVQSANKTMKDIEVKDGLELVIILNALKRGKESMEKENRHGTYDKDIQFLEDKIEEIGSRKVNISLE